MPEDRCDLLCLDLKKAEALRRRRLDPGRADLLSSRTGALADPTRLTIAVALAEGGQLCVCDLTWVTERSENLVSHHLRVLREAGVVRSRRDGKMVMYSMTGAGQGLLGAVNAPVQMSTR